MLTLTTASAGSGKTYRLAQEFIRLALEPGQPRAFAGVLAVTFTKKAAGEIKARVLAQLKAMAEGDMDLPVQSSRHTRELAAQVHRAILEQYDAFAVLTLDSFFQRIIRAFAIELDLPGNYRIQLDQEEVKELAVDRLLGRDSSRPEVRPLLRRMVVEQLEDEGKWNVRKRIAGFADQLFKSSFARYEPLLEQQHTLVTDEVLDQIRAERKRLDEDLTALAETAIAVLVDLREQGGVPPSSNVKWILGKLKKDIWELPDGDSGYIRMLLEDATDPAIYFNKKEIASKPEITHTLAERVAPALEAIVVYVRRNRSRYYTLQLLYDNLPDTLLTSALSHEVGAVRAERNLFLLYQQAMFLSRITAESSTPFIYDRIGLRLRHYLIDEMQDTSRDQWQALRPLLENSLASDEANLIVGDVKQAIYRWRDGDAGLMLGRIAEDLTGMVKSERLEYNYRSLGMVVDFNNALVRHLPMLTQNALSQDEDLTLLPAEKARHIIARTELLPQAFAGGEQRIPADKAERLGQGYVRVEFHASKSKKKGEGAEDGETELPLAEQRLLAWLEEIFSLGYGPGDVCILVRRKGQATTVAEILMRKEAEGDTRYAFSSADSLSVDRAVTVRFLLAMLRVLVRNEDALARLEAGYLYTHFLKRDETLAESIYQQPPSLEALLELLPPAVAHAWGELAMATPAQTLETLAGLCGLHEVKAEQGFLMALLETAHAFESDEGGTQTAFLTYWERKATKLKVDMPPTGDRIQIQTVHASKGLEYPVVLVPFADWKLDEAQHSELLWLPSDPQRYYGVALGAFAYGRRLRQSDFAEEAYDEMLARALDALNLAYVAFTRAQRMLYIGTPEASKDMRDGKKEAGSLTDLLHLHLAVDTTATCDESITGVRAYALGNPLGPEGERRSQPPRLEPEIRFPHRFKKPLQPSPAVGLKSGLWEEDEILLKLFRTAEADGRVDERVAYQMVRDGVVTNARMQEARETYEAWRRLPQAAVLWGGPETLLRCEPTLLDSEGRAYVPDRVLFDGAACRIVHLVIHGFSEEAIHAQELLVGAARALQALGKLVTGVYRVTMAPFTVERLEL